MPLVIRLDFSILNWFDAFDNFGILKTDKSPTDLEHVAIQLESMLPRSAKYHIWRLNVENISLNFTPSSSSDSIHLAKQNMTDTLSMIDSWLNTLYVLETSSMLKISQKQYTFIIHSVDEFGLFFDVLERNE
ncbi:unnamed protein product, partial [Rotaria sp. Silwood1]